MVVTCTTSASLTSKTLSVLLSTLVLASFPVHCEGCGLAWEQGCSYIMHISCHPDQSRYTTLTEDEILEILHEKMLTEEEFHSLKQRTKQTLKDMSN